MSDRQEVRASPGIVALIAGPDGSGKSTLAERLSRDLASNFAGTIHLHWRPGVLPRLGAVLGRPVGDSSTPHANAPHGKVVSLLVVGYYWLDFVVGGWLKVHRLRRFGRLIVLERGWQDLAVDARRYRLTVSPVLVKALARFVPSPDLVLVLEAPAQILLERKQELPIDELSRQVQMWRSIKFPRAKRTVYLDVRSSMDQIFEESRRHVLDLSGVQTVKRSGQESWVALPTRRAPRWLLPRVQSRAGQAALLLYYPQTFRARAAWRVLHRVSGAGGFRYLRPYRTPPREVSDAVRPYLSQGSAVAVVKANHPGRFVALVVDRGGDLRAFVKVARDTAGAETLRREREALARFGPLLPLPLSAPQILDYRDGLLVEKPVRWSFQARPWSLPEPVAHALGRFFRATASESGVLKGAAHGDCAPWNLLRAESGWVLVDWENALDAMPPYYDVFHFIVQANGELRRPLKATILDALDLKGPIAGTIRAYAEGANLDPRDAKSYFAQYLELSNAQHMAAMATRAVRVRGKLLSMLRASDGTAP